jgi:hypothetical protein
MHITFNFSHLLNIFFNYKLAPCAAPVLGPLYDQFSFATKTICFFSIIAAKKFLLRGPARFASAGRWPAFIAPPCRL